MGGASAGITAPADQFRVADPLLSRVGELLKLAAASPAVDAGSAAYPFVTEDVDGQPRAKHDIGADELSSAPESYHPLSPADVGPGAP